MARRIRAGRPASWVANAASTQARWCSRPSAATSSRPADPVLLGQHPDDPVPDHLVVVEEPGRQPRQVDWGISSRGGTVARTTPWPRGSASPCSRTPGAPSGTLVSAVEATFSNVNSVD